MRLGETIGQDMVAVRIGADMRMAAVASPAYFADHEPLQTPHDLAKNGCINLRFPTHGGLYAWEFERLAYLPEDYVLGDVEEGRLVRAPEDWCHPFPGYHLYYPSRRQLSPALALVVEALRSRD